MARLYLTKTKTIAGLQCLRRLWLLDNDPPPYDDAPAGSPVEIGQEVGMKAHLLFPGGVLVDEAPWEHDQAVARTARLMADPQVPAIFEAAFECDGIRIRADILERLGGNAWGLREVKASGGVTDYHLNDLAVQTYVLMCADVALASTELVHVNTGYVRGETLDWQQFFARKEVMPEVSERLWQVRDRLPDMRACLAGNAPPDMSPGDHCADPFGCEYWERCTADKPEDWIVHLPRLSAAKREELTARGIEAISAIPADYPLSAGQARIRDALVSGKPYISANLASLLQGFGPPALYLDFEAMLPAIPLYPGTRPYQTLPFQWSLHRLSADGALGHDAFLADGRVDPREAFAESLISAVGDEPLPIVVYSAYEASRLRELAALFPHLAGRLEAISGRLVDLLPVVREGVYLAEFWFSRSIKAVAPALCPGFGYEDLADVADGSAAAATFVRLASGQAEPEEAARLRMALLKYCERDTLAMVEVHRALRTLAGV